MQAIEGNSQYKTLRFNEQNYRNLWMPIEVEDDTLYALQIAASMGKLERDLSRLPNFNKSARKIQRLLIGHATDAELDTSGRLLIPPPLRQYAGLEKKAVLIGQGRKFELWSEDVWQARRDAWLKEDAFESEDLPDGMKSISL